MKRNNGRKKKPTSGNAWKKKKINAVFLFLLAVCVWMLLWSAAHNADAKNIFKKINK